MKNKKTRWDYTNLAKNYDFRPDYSTKIVKNILKMINCKKYYPVADIGAGTGKLTKLLCKNNLIVSAIEPNKYMRRYGKKNTKNFKNVTWISSTGENSRLNSNSFYCVFFGSSFNVINKKKTIKEMKRVLIDKGYLCCLWNYRDLQDLHQLEIEKIIKSYIPKYKHGERRSNYKNILNKANSFKNIKTIHKRFIVKFYKRDFLNAWKSHATLKKNCKNLKQFKSIIRSIALYLDSLNKDYIQVPYNTVAYIACLK